MIRTERLILRQWDDEDLYLFSQMCRDNDVMEFFPKVLTEEESYSMGRKIKSFIAERGWGFWAVEIPGQSKFVGFVGLHIPKESMRFHHVLRSAGVLLNDIGAWVTRQRPPMSHCGMLLLTWI